MNRVDFEMAPADIIEAKRIHHQWLPDQTRLERGLMDEATSARLEAMGHRVTWTSRQGIAHAIFVSESGQLVGVPDPREDDGTAAGY